MQIDYTDTETTITLTNKEAEDLQSNLFIAAAGLENSEFRSDWETAAQLRDIAMRL